MPNNKEKILHILQESGSFISGEDICRRLGISRTAVWKNVHALMDEGYEIESISNRGYRLCSSPDTLNAEAVLPYLHTNALGHALRFYRTIDSTNTEAKRRAAEGDAHGTVYVAEEQTRGKGRLGRQWVSPPGEGLWFTVLLRPDCIPAQTAGLTLVTGLAVCQTIRELCGIDARIKWPNDIVLGSKKLCGILLEMSAEENHVDYVIAGIGINVNIGDFPEEIAYKATSLRLACGHSLCRGELLAAFLNIYEPLLQLYTENRTEEILVPYRELCVSLGRQVSTQRPQGLLTGTAVDITRGGELVIRTPTGEEETVFTGEVSVQGIYDRPEEKQA